MHFKESNPFPESTNIAEHMLINQAIKGDQEAFAKLYGLYYDRIVSFIYKKISNFEVSEQLTQETFLKAFKNIRKYENKVNTFGPWIFRIAKNLTNNYLGREIRRSSPADIATVLGMMDFREQKVDVLANTIIQQELHGMLQAAIKKLPEQQRAVLEWKLINGWEVSNQEIAREMKLTESSIKSHYWRALINLKKFMKREE